MFVQTRSGRSTVVYLNVAEARATAAHIEVLPHFLGIWEN